MSGGSLSYFYLQLQEHIGDFGDEELDDLVKDLADLFYAREWYLSSDTCKDDWREARDKFKDKWFTEYGRQERIKKYIEEIRSDVLDRFGIDDRKRDTCKYWSHDSLISCEDAISRQSAIDALSHMCSEDENGITVSRANVNSMLRVLPSVQPEIIQCKDCKHHHRDNNGTYYCGRNGYGWKLNDFCSDAERRTN